MISVSLAKAPLSLERRRPSPLGAYRRWARRPAGRVAHLVVVAAVCGAVWMAWRTTLVTVGVAEDNVGLSLRSSVAGAEPLRFVVQRGGTVRASLSGVDLSGVARQGSSLTVQLPPGLPEGGYELRLTVDRPFPLPSTSRRWTVTIDDRPPDFELASALEAARLDEPVSLRFAAEAAVTVAVEDLAATPHVVEAVPAGDRATVTVTFAHPPAGEVRVVARDAAGNERALPLTVPVAYPAATRAAHITAVGWAAAEVREPFLQLVDAGLIDTVQLDLKDESGIVGYDSQVPLARQIGAVQPSFELAEVVAELERRGVRVIGRIVAFRDPVLAEWAWRQGHHDWVVQNVDGEPFDAYGGFTNYAHQAVRDYNLDLAEEAAAAGVDDILWDYVRRPEGDPTEMLVPQLTGTGATTGDMIVAFLGQAQARLRPLGVYQGASVFGIAATRPENIGQPVDRIAAVVDYVAPMVYPSHYVDGECGVRRPRTEPYAIVACSLGDFRVAMAGSTAALVPWLQDFSLDGVSYGAHEVAEQVRAASDAGADGFLLWNPSANYSYAGV